MTAPRPRYSCARRQTCARTVSVSPPVAGAAVAAASVSLSRAASCSRCCTTGTTFCSYTDANDVTSASWAGVSCSARAEREAREPKAMGQGAH